MASTRKRRFGFFAGMRVGVGLKRRRDILANAVPARKGASIAEAAAPLPVCGFRGGSDPSAASASNCGRCGIFGHGAAYPTMDRPKTTPAMSEAELTELLSQVRAGNGDAWGELYVRHAPAI